MKKIIIYLPLCGLLLASCDAMLDVNPSDKYSTATFWADEEQYDAGLIGCYNSLYDSQNFFNAETEMVTPNAKAYNESNGTDGIAKGAALSTTVLFQNFWRSSYRSIGRANTFLDQIDHAPFDEAKRNQMKGEALFIRALYYSYLANHFGGVPLILSTPDNAAQGKLPRNKKEEVVDQIIKDLTLAASLLKTAHSSSDIGRVTKGAALALKARILLYNEQWAEAAKAAKEVIDLNVYGLFPNYRGMYLLENENNEEVIFDIQYKAPYYKHELDNAIVMLNRPAPLKDLVDAYLMTDGKSISESSLYDPSNPYENRDPRLHQTVVCIGYPYNGKITQPSNVVTTGFGLKKMTTYTDNTTTSVTAGNSEVNLIVLRYAEVLLTYAEALNEANSFPDSEVYWALNTIRKRPTVEMPDIASGLTKGEMKDVIRLERRIELAGEGLYLMDIRRWKIADVVNNGPIYNYQGIEIEKRAFNKDRDYLWPVPEVEMQENANLEQNPGW